MQTQKKKASFTAVFFESDNLNQARFLNSLVRVLISILSPISIKAATAK